MTGEQAKAALDKVQAAMHEQFPGAVERLAQLDSHLATVDMTVEHLFDEHERT